MSTTTVTTWKCDYCGKEGKSVGKDYPDGWIGHRLVMRIGKKDHPLSEKVACPACVKEKGL